MRKNILGIFAVAGGYAAAVIGAGFASGQEIVSFFVRYGKHGLTGIILACVIFVIFAGVVLSFCVERKITSYTTLLESIFKGRMMKKISEGVVFLCSMASMCVMTACAGEIGSSVYGAPVIMGSAVFSVICGMIFLMEAKYLMGSNAALGIIIIAGIIFSCFYILRFREHQTMAVPTAATLSGATYAGYNIVGTGAILAGMSRFLKSKADAVISAAVSGIMLFIMMVLIWGVLSIYYGKINLGEIPMLTMTFRQGRMFGVFYSTMLAAAVLTTGISSGFAMIDILKRRMNVKNAAGVVLFVSFCASGAGFSGLIDTLYRFCGVAGAVISIVIVYKISIKAKNGDNRRKKEYNL